MCGLGKPAFNSWTDESIWDTTKHPRSCELTCRYILFYLSSSWVKLLWERRRILTFFFGLSSFRDKRVSGEVLFVVAMTSKKLCRTWYVPVLLFKRHAFKNKIRPEVSFFVFLFSFFQLIRDSIVTGITPVFTVENVTSPLSLRCLHVLWSLFGADNGVLTVSGLWYKPPEWSAFVPLTEQASRVAFGFVSLECFLYKKRVNSDWSYTN